MDVSNGKESDIMKKIIKQRNQKVMKLLWKSTLKRLSFNEISSERQNGSPS